MMAQLICARVCLLLALLFFGCPSLVFAGSSFYGNASKAIELPTPLGYVSDYANVLDPEWESRIRAVCKDLERGSGVEMIVVVMDTIHPLSSAQDFAMKMYEGWRIGTAQQERGILLLASVKEKQAVVVLGRSLLSVVTPAQLDRLSTEFFLPMFKTREFGRGIYQAAVSLASSSMTAKQKKPRHGSNVGFWMNVSAALAMLYALWRFTRPERLHPFRRWHRGEYWGTGQGGFGGGFGGFGGGMGGRGLQ